MKAPHKLNMDTKDTLEEVSWSVPVFSSVAELRAGTPGICLANAQETTQAIAELKSSAPLAVLATKNVRGAGTEMLVCVKDKHGKLNHRIRFLIQLGAPAVTLTQCVHSRRQFP